jgi:hypothetical protein
LLVLLLAGASMPAKPAGDGRTFQVFASFIKYLDMSAALMTGYEGGRNTLPARSADESERILASHPATLVLLKARFCS